MFWEHQVLSEASRFHLKLSPCDRVPLLRHQKLKPCCHTRVDHARSQPPTSNKNIEKGPKKVLPRIAVCHIRHPPPFRDGSLRSSSNPRTAPSPSVNLLFPVLSVPEMRAGAVLGGGMNAQQREQMEVVFAFQRSTTEPLCSVITR